MKKDESCETCKFYMDVKIMIHSGHCRRYPPTIISEVESDSNSDGVLNTVCSNEYSIFPSVQRDDWCGEYKEKEIKINE